MNRPRTNDEKLFICSAYLRVVPILSLAVRWFLFIDLIGITAASCKKTHQSDALISRSQVGGVVPKTYDVPYQSGLTFLLKSSHLSTSFALLTDGIIVFLLSCLWPMAGITSRHLKQSASLRGVVHFFRRRLGRSLTHYNC
jgi:hypothetical protein